MATKKAAAKKKAVSKKKAPAKTARSIPDGWEKFTFNLPTKLVNKFKAQAKRIKKAGEQNGDGRWGYQSLIRETLETASARFRA